VWGAALLSSLVPHQGVSWQAHLCGAIGGVVAAWLLAARSARKPAASGPGGTGAGANASSSASVDDMLRALAK
jgi:hypothetical protein